MSKPTRLKGLRLRRVSLVDDPANQFAKVLIHKSRQPESPVTKDEDVSMSKCSGCGAMNKSGTTKCLKCGVNMTDKSKSADPLNGIEDPEVKKAVEKMQADLAAATALLEKAAKEEGKGKEDVEKADLRKRLEQAEEKARFASEAIEKLNDQAIEKTYQDEAAKEFGKLSGDSKVLGSLLFRVEKKRTTEDDVKELRRILKAANAAMKPLMTVVGSGERTVAKGQKAADVLETKVREVMKSDGLKYGEALDKVAHDEPQLWADHINERRSVGGQPIAIGEDE